jgi:hypothetical protein
MSVDFKCHMRLSSSVHGAISTLHTNSVCEVPNRLCLFRASLYGGGNLTLATSRPDPKKAGS